MILSDLLRGSLEKETVYSK